MKKIFLPLFCMLSCSPDYGITTKEQIVIEEVYTGTEIVGNPVVDSGTIYNQAIDILLVVDESCSMADDQETLALALPDIYDILTGKQFINLEWRIGIKSTDSDDGGIYNWVSYDESNVELKLYTMTTLLENHSEEAGLDSAINSLAWEKTDFYRKDSDLLIIYISDEPDQSLISVSEYESLIATIKYPPFEATEVAITVTTLDDRCDNANDLGTGYLDVAEVAIDLCDTKSWASALDRPQEHLPTLNEIWHLSEIPVYPSDIQVEISENDGASWSLFHDWTYDASDNSVRLTAIPNAGTWVNIIYLSE